MVSYIPTEGATIETIRKKHQDICSSCSIRKMLAKLVDLHVDWMDCPYDCQNDYDHFLRTVKETGGFA